PETIDCLNPNKACPGKAKYMSCWGDRLRYKCPDCNFTTQVPTKFGTVVGHVKRAKLVIGLFTGGAAISSVAWIANKSWEGVKKAVEDPEEAARQLARTPEAVKETFTVVRTKVTETVTWTYE